MPPPVAPKPRLRLNASRTATPKRRTALGSLDNRNEVTASPKVEFYDYKQEDLVQVVSTNEDARECNGNSISLPIPD
jgi:hypothetical protein